MKPEYAKHHFELLRSQLSELPLSHSQKEYLREVFERAANGEKDPFGLIDPKNYRATWRRDLQLAQEVFETIETGKCLVSDAVDRVADLRGLSGSDGGTVHKAWKKYGCHIKAIAEIYDARVVFRILCHFFTMVIKEVT
ncbi:MAG: hypothetical protein ACWA44_13545, partial [Thiotrichales bacterium]